MSSMTIAFTAYWCTSCHTSRIRSYHLGWPYREMKSRDGTYVLRSYAGSTESTITKWIIKENGLRLGLSTISNVQQGYHQRNRSWKRLKIERNELKTTDKKKNQNNILNNRTSVCEIIDNFHSICAFYVG